MTKYVFNWPSGGGGDFILSLIYSYYEDSGHFSSNPRLNLWSVENKYTSDYRTFKYFDQPEKQQQVLDNMPDMCTLQTHSIARHDPLEYDDNTQVFNIYMDDRYIESYCWVLYTIKTVQLEHDQFKGLMSMNGKLPDVKNCHNISYRKLFIEQDPQVIKHLFDLYNVKDYDINEVQRLLKAYDDKNNRILTITFFEDTIDRTDKRMVRMSQRKTMAYCLEKPPAKTIEAQRKIVQEIEYFDQQ